MKKDRYVSELNKITLCYNICMHLRKCNTDEERCNTVKRILNNFEMVDAVCVLTKDDLNEIVDKNTCICCGKVIPEGRQVCLDCSEE